jgi:hypothetical protein
MAINSKHRLIKSNRQIQLFFYSLLFLCRVSAQDTANNQPLTGQDSLYGSACIDSLTREIVIKLVNTSPYPKDIIIRLAGVRGLVKYWPKTSAPRLFA